MGRVAEVITARIANADLVVGDSIKQTGLADELGFPRTRVEAAVAKLVDPGRLEYTGEGSARRAVVV
jgi:DNA-binding GntR family transcriptional regulator